jgi:hypothetical protein
MALCASEESSYCTHVGTFTKDRKDVDRGPKIYSPVTLKISHQRESYYLGVLNKFFYNFFYRWVLIREINLIFSLINL